MTAFSKERLQQIVDEPNGKQGGPSLLAWAIARFVIEREEDHRREILKARIEELENATATVCQGCAEGIDYWPMDGTHRRQTSDDGDCEGGPCNCHELSDRLHGLRSELSALMERP